MAAAIKRLVQPGLKSAISITKMPRFNSSKLAAAAAFASAAAACASAATEIHRSRHFSQQVDPLNVKYLDKLSLVKDLKAKGFSSEDAEAMTAAFSEYFDQHLAQSFVSNEEMGPFSSMNTWLAEINRKLDEFGKQLEEIAQMVKELHRKVDELLGKDKVTEV